jgi:hypothetical protein
MAGHAGEAEPPARHASVRILVVARCACQTGRQAGTSGYFEVAVSDWTEHMHLAEVEQPVAIAVGLDRDLKFAVAGETTRDVLATSRQPMKFAKPCGSRRSGSPTRDPVSGSKPSAKM